MLAVSGSINAIKHLQATAIEAENGLDVFALWEEMADVPVYIVHLSAAEALEMVTEARDRGLPAYAETCPQYLFLSYDNYEEPGVDGAKYVMSPPLREKWHQDHLWKGLSKNDLQVISTDHCPFCMKEQKELGKDDFSKIPNGAPGIETRLTLVHNGGVRPGRISLNRFVELCSTTPAKMFGLFPRKGTIAVGSDADVVVFDPNRKATLGVNVWTLTGSSVRFRDSPTPRGSDGSVRSSSTKLCSSSVPSSSAAWP